MPISKRPLLLILVSVLLALACSLSGCQAPLHNDKPMHSIAVSISSDGVPSHTPCLTDSVSSPLPHEMTTTAVEQSTIPTPSNAVGTTPIATATDLPIATAAPTPTAATAVTPVATLVPYPTPDTPNSFAADYGGAVVDCKALNTGDTFFWTLNLLNDGSCLYAGHWLIDHPDAYITPIACSVSWEGGLAHTINQAWDDGEPSSDKPAFVYNVYYEGMTGGSPYGEADNFYTVVGMYLTSFDYHGIQSSGSVIRVQYEVKSLPPIAAMLHDSDGYYLPIHIIVLESAAFVDVTVSVTHGNITVTPGKLYFAS